MPRSLPAPSRAISGAAVATAVAVGVVMIPAMKKAGYDEDVGAALTCTAACMGPIIRRASPSSFMGSRPTSRSARCFWAACFPASCWVRL